MPFRTELIYTHVQIAVFIYLYLPFSNNVALKKGLRLQIVETTLSGSFKIFFRKPILRGTLIQTAGQKNDIGTIYRCVGYVNPV